LNKFAQKGSWLFLAMSWLFVVALFIDGANVTDIFSETSTVHFDDGSFDFSNGTDMPMVGALTCANAGQLTSGVEVGTTLPSTIRHLVFDQDSPSLAATDVVTLASIGVFPKDEKIVYETLCYSSSLYLRHCTLLI
jgi:hypothetical protein